ncbi:peptidylprolyl isomerase [Nocardioides ginsengisegetis]|uniref:Peptidyl-prolyl cis-trans isomerase n=1 Tax=Nocardioides ginsengisegetis TaxID=661491 RepID=A0A7W3IZC2_9ACTN|nr:peptidylprolyl isomerase [Nocardioides ginsengisegetis]
MSRRFRRLPLALLPLVLVAALSGCGSDDGSSSDSGSQALDAVSISGDFGSEPTVDWKGKMTADTIENTTITEGDGATVEDGDTVTTNIWIGNGFTQKKAFSTYDAKQPQDLTIDDQKVSPVFVDAIKGATIGSRIAVTAPADKAFGASGNTQLGIGNKDSVLIIIDLMSEPTPPLDAPKGASKPSPAWAPKLVQKDGAVTSLDFSKAPEPDGKLHSAALIQGTGAVVKKGQTITVNYLGQVYGGKKPFDESYSKGDPVSFGIGSGQVIPGWDKTLVGAKIGSRMILAIPPADGYGKAGQPSAGIKGTDTLYFVVDILGAS